MPVSPSPTSSMFLNPLSVLPQSLMRATMPGGKGIVGSPGPSPPVFGLPAVAHDSTLGEGVGEACGEPKHHHVALPEVPDLLLLHVHVPDVTEQDHHCRWGQVSGHVPRPPCPSLLDAGTVALGTQCRGLEPVCHEGAHVTPGRRPRGCWDPALDVTGSDPGTGSCDCQLTSSRSEREHPAGLLP